MKKLIVTGDDFGLSTPVNDAIVTAHEKGILTTTSLMVSAPAAADAIARASGLPDLNVGLHIVLSNGKATLPAVRIPLLVNRAGEFSDSHVSSGIRMFFDPACKAQLKDELVAQFEAFRATGLRLDHVNAHNHMHLHPTVFDLIVEVGRDFGLSAIRIPDEPPLESIISSNRERVRRYLRWKFLRPFISRMRKRCAKSNITVNDIVYGFNDSGHMNIDTLIHIIPHIADGLTEIYMHPATERWPDIDPAAHSYEFEAEYKALTHVRVRRAIAKFDIELTGFNT